MSQVRAKFNVSEFTRFNNTGGTGRVVLIPVINNSEENKKFWQYTPSGKLEMYIDNPEALKVFESIREFYLDFTPAE